MTGPPAADWRPDWAYVPGQTPRHPDGLFDPIRGTVTDADPMTSAAWRVGLAFLRDGYFWEAHEVLEPVWMACPAGSPDRALVQALIQLANAGLKRRMGRDRAVMRLLQMADNLAAQADGAAEKAVFFALRALMDQS